MIALELLVLGVRNRCVLPVRERRWLLARPLTAFQREMDRPRPLGGVPRFREASLARFSFEILLLAAMGKRRLPPADD